MAITEIIKENEELRIRYARALETIARLERENEKLKQQLEALRRDHEELRRIMKYYKRKYEKLRDIIVRAFKISEEMRDGELTLKDLRRMLTGELTKRR